MLQKNCCIEFFYEVLNIQRSGNSWMMIIRSFLNVIDEQK